MQSTRSCLQIHPPLTQSPSSAIARIRSREHISDTSQIHICHKTKQANSKTETSFSGTIISIDDNGTSLGVQLPYLFRLFLINFGSYAISHHLRFHGLAVRCSSGQFVVTYLLVGCQHGQGAKALIDLAHAGGRSRQGKVGDFAGGKRRGGRFTVLTKIIDRVGTA